MKKAVLIVSALLLVVSGVAAVSAYEAHIVDIKAHVENALLVSENVSFGIVFPQDTVEREVCIGLSESFRSEEQERYSAIMYALYWTPKAIYGDAIDPDDDGFFEPIYPFLTVTPEQLAVEDGTLPNSPPPGWNALPAGPEGYYKFGWGQLAKANDLSDCWHFTFNVPVFDKWYNEDTDLKAPWPNILYIDNNDYEIVTENFTCCEDERVIYADCPHADLGSNLKIQVYDYVTH